MGKSSNKKYRFGLVNVFFEDFEKTFKQTSELKELSLQRPAFFTAPFAMGVRTMVTSAPGSRSFVFI